MCRLRRLPNCVVVESEVVHGEVGDGVVVDGEVVHGVVGDGVVGDGEVVDGVVVAVGRQGLTDVVGGKDASATPEGGDVRALGAAEVGAEGCHGQPLRHQRRCRGRY